MLEWEKFSDQIIDDDRGRRGKHPELGSPGKALRPLQEILAERTAKKNTAAQQSTAGGVKRGKGKGKAAKKISAEKKQNPIRQRRILPRRASRNPRAGDPGRSELCTALQLPSDYRPEDDSEIQGFLERWGWSEIQPPELRRSELDRLLRPRDLGSKFEAAGLGEKYPGLGSDQAHLRQLEQFREFTCLRALRYAYDLASETGKQGRKRQETKQHFEWFAGDMIFLFRNLIYRASGEVQVREKNGDLDSNPGPACLHHGMMLLVLKP